MNKNQEYLDFAKELALEAGDIMLKYFLTDNLDLKLKGDNTPVTLADTEVNSLVIARVKEKYPDHGVLGEEETYNQDCSGLWVCDPIDGTSMFARGMSGWVFSLAYVENGRPKVGVIYDPLMRRLFWAAEGQGAYENERKLVLANEIPKGPLEIFSWTAGAHKAVIFKDKGIESRIIEAYNKYGDIFAYDGPVAHYLALAAAGRLDAAVSSCKNPWDLAAGSFIAQQAGAKVTDIYGVPVERWDENIKGIIAAPPKLHELLLEIILPVVKDAPLQ